MIEQLDSLKGNPLIDFLCTINPRSSSHVNANPKCHDLASEINEVFILVDLGLVSPGRRQT